MPLYDFRCRTCGDTFEIRRSMVDSSAPAACPAGHADTVKLMPLVAVGGRADVGPSTAPSPAVGGGCCGGACGCG